jgi:hypothetical protein
MTIRAGEEVGMRGANNEQSSMFSYISAERRVPKDHPLRAIRAMADMALKALDQRFAGMYAALGRPSIAPERLLRALLLQVLYTVCQSSSENHPSISFEIPPSLGVVRVAAITDQRAALTPSLCCY